jgi:hypothetical protein
MRANHRGANLHALERMLEVAMADRCGPHDKRAIGNGLGNSFVLFSAGQNIRGIHGGACALKSHVVGIHHTEMAKSEVAHRPGSRANVEGIARIHQDDSQMIEFSRNRQAVLILRQPSRKWSGPFRGPGSDSRGGSVRCKPFAVESSGWGVQM